MPSYYAGHTEQVRWSGVEYGEWIVIRDAMDMMDTGGDTVGDRRGIEPWFL